MKIWVLVNVDLQMPSESFIGLWALWFYDVIISFYIALFGVFSERSLSQCYTWTNLAINRIILWLFYVKIVHWNW